MLWTDSLERGVWNGPADMRRHSEETLTKVKIRELTTIRRSETTTIFAMGDNQVKDRVTVSTYQDP
jgi:hypothetical protein